MKIIGLKERSYKPEDSEMTYNWLDCYVGFDAYRDGEYGMICYPVKCSVQAVQNYLVRESYENVTDMIGDDVVFRYYKDKEGNKTNKACFIFKRNSINVKDEEFDL